MTNVQEQADDEFVAVHQAMKLFPKRFGLLGLPGEMFCISLDNSYISSGEPVLVVLRLTPDDHELFRKFSVTELQREVVKLP